jgi:hypothetical protein
MEQNSPVETFQSFQTNRSFWKSSGWALEICLFHLLSVWNHRNFHVNGEQPMSRENQLMNVNNVAPTRNNYGILECSRNRIYCRICLRVKLYCWLRGDFFVCYVTRASIGFEHFSLQIRDIEKNCLLIIDILYTRLDSASLLVKLKPRIFQRLPPFE